MSYYGIKNKKRTKANAQMFHDGLYKPILTAKTK